MPHLSRFSLASIKISICFLSTRYLSIRYLAIRYLTKYFNQPAWPVSPSSPSQSQSLPPLEPLSLATVSLPYKISICSLSTRYLSIGYLQIFVNKIFQRKYLWRAPPFEPGQYLRLTKYQFTPCQPDICQLKIG